MLAASGTHVQKSMTREVRSRNEALARGNSGLNKHTVACAGDDIIGVRVLTCRMWAVGPIWRRGAQVEEPEPVRQCGSERIDSSRTFEDMSRTWAETIKSSTLATRSRNHAASSSATLARAPADERRGHLSGPDGSVVIGVWLRSMCM